MRSLHFLLIIGLLCAGFLITLAQTAGDFQTVSSGNWESVSTWQQHNGTEWVAATSAPDTNAGKINILKDHIVTITANIAIDSVEVDSAGKLIINEGVVVTVPFNNGAFGIKVTGGAAMDVHGKILNMGLVTRGGTGLITFKPGSIYEHARNGGSIPVSKWDSASTILFTGVTANAPSNGSQNFYNVIWNCPSQTSNLNLGWNGNTICGNITCISSGTNRIYFTSPTAYVDPITIMGDVIVTGGTLSTNGSSSYADIKIYQYGNIIVTGGNFGCSRGSAPKVEWYLYGDSMSVTACSLQNSTGGTTPQKFIFAKKGVQKLNARWFAATPSRIGFQVNEGTTLDIGRSFSNEDTTCNNMNGGFRIEPGGAVLSTHDEFGQGRIRTSGAYGDQSNALDVNVFEGSGTVKVTAFAGDHPAILASSPNDTANMLKRYWRVEADPGITAAKITMYYNDRLPPSDIRGGSLAEFNYQAIRIYQFGDEWRKWVDVDSSYSDDVKDFVVSGIVSKISGDWTAGDGTVILSGVKERELNVVPQEFFVAQNYPNPFNPTTAIRFGIPNASNVSIKVFNLLGQEVATLFNGLKPAGTHEIVFDASKLSSGIYLYRVQAGSFVDVKRMILLK